MAAGPVAGRVAVVVGTRGGGVGGVGSASTAAGRLVCWRSIDGWLSRLGLLHGWLGAIMAGLGSIGGWLLGSPITDVAPGAARKFRSLTNATARVQSLNQCVAPASRPATLAHGQRAARDFWARLAPAAYIGPNRSATPPRRPRKELRLN